MPECSVCGAPATHSCKDCDEVFCEGTCAVAYHYKWICGKKEKKTKKQRRRKFLEETNVESVVVTTDDVTNVPLEEIDEQSFLLIKILLQTALIDPYAAAALCSTSKAAYTICKVAVFSLEIPLCASETMKGTTLVVTPVDIQVIMCRGTTELAQYSKAVTAYKQQIFHTEWNLSKFLLVSSQYALFNRLNTDLTEFSDCMSELWGQAKALNGTTQILQLYGGYKVEDGVNGLDFLRWAALSLSNEQILDNTIRIYSDEADGKEKMRRWIFFLREVLMYAVNDETKLSFVRATMPPQYKVDMLGVVIKLKTMKILWFNAGRWEKERRIKRMMKKLWPNVDFSIFDTEDPTPFYPTKAVNRWPITAE